MYERKRRIEVFVSGNARSHARGVHFLPERSIEASVPLLRSDSLRARPQVGVSQGRSATRDWTFHAALYGPQWMYARAGRKAALHDASLHQSRWRSALSRTAAEDRRTRRRRLETLFGGTLMADIDMLSVQMPADAQAGDRLAVCVASDQAIT